MAGISYSGMNTDRGFYFRSNQLDALRFVAFLMVFAVHSLPGNAASYPQYGDVAALIVGSGRWGVDVFFVLSAFLITKVPQNMPDLGEFYRRRLVRIVPLFFVFLGVMAFFYPTWTYLIGFATFTGNFVMAAYGLPPSAIAPAWSLCVEMQFYVLWPLLMRFGVRRVALCMLALSIALRVIWAWTGAANEAAWVMTFTRLDPFALGALLATVRIPRVEPVSGLVFGAVGIVAGEAMLHTGLWPMAYTVAAFGAVAIVVSAMSVKTIPVMLSNLGKMSYGMYLFHAGLIVVAHNYLPMGWQLGALASTIMLATLSYRYIERRMMKTHYAAIKPRETSAA